MAILDRGCHLWSGCGGIQVSHSGVVVASRTEHRVVRLAVEPLSSLRPILLHGLRMESTLQAALPRLRLEFAWRVTAFSLSTANRLQT